MDNSNNVYDVEKIVEMVQWEDFKRWECASESDSKSNTDEENLAKAQRFISAQSFMLAWQQGKVPAGWTRPRRLDDFQGKYPEVVLDEALSRIEERIVERNEALTAHLAKRVASGAPGVGGGAFKMGSEKEKGKVTKEEIEKLKKFYAQLNSNVYSVKQALSNASAAVAEVVVKTMELEKKIETKV